MSKRKREFPTKAMGSWLGTLMGYRPGRLGRGALLGTGGLIARAVIQAAYLLILSRWLGASGYGLFAGCVALAVLGAPLANWGSSLLLTRYIAQDRGKSRAMLATAITQTLVVGGLLTLVVLGLSTSVLQETLPLAPMLLLALSELVLLPIAWAAASQCYALERGGAAAVVVCLMPLGRVIVVLACLAFDLPGTADVVAIAHFAGSAVGCVAVLFLMIRIDGWPKWSERLPLIAATRQGTAYALSSVASTSYQEVDKVLMLQLLGAAAVGPYTVAFRVVSIFLVPLSALVSATLPRLIAQHGDIRVPRTFRVLVFVATTYGLLAGMFILLSRSFIPHIFGADYGQVAGLLLLLAPWPVFFALRQCWAAKLTAMNRQATRSVLEMLGLLLVLLLNLMLLPHVGAKASVISLLITEVLVLIGFLFFVERK
ncbi:lipopolysaccharide biosynthesis protein [Pseudoxanthomonas sp.]|jgi:Membrane protein involved in the export of O-antigen and teichoic acid|uniref:lipopolysaccharide biosynthesis protein n=1 Tax=Pseudoxanthomonas sp. TaxID=1871049 RepID=UPI002FE36671